MRFMLICPALETEVDGDEPANTGYSRTRVIALLDALRQRNRWPYELFENADPGERERLYRDEAVPAAAYQGVLPESTFGPEPLERFGTVITALIAYDRAGNGVGLYPSRDGSGERTPIVDYLAPLLDGTASIPH